MDSERVSEIEEKLKAMEDYLNLKDKIIKLKKLEEVMSSPSFWDAPKEADKIVAEIKTIQKWIKPYNQSVERLKEVKELLSEIDCLDEEEKKAFSSDLEGEIEEIERKVSDLECMKMLSGEMDKNSCFFSINAGAGGTEACDWVKMLSRMYNRWFESRGWKIELVDLLEGEDAGIKSVTYKVSGEYSYGFCKAESGVHRLVRISPFDSNKRRHTSFASVEATPEIEEELDVEIAEEDVRIDTYRSSGAGGQHVNTTDSAVRITHLPTGIVVQCQNERSQIKNRATCMKMLKAKLYQMEMEIKRKEIESMGGTKKEIGWGSQIRSYVFQPYQMVKDHRTKYEEGNINSIMDGEIDRFVIAFLREFG